MSFIRLLSPMRGMGRPSVSSSYSSSAPLENPDKPSIAIHVPAYGVVRMNYIDPSSQHRDDKLLTGELEVRLPAGKRRRCKSMRIGVTSEYKINWSEGKSKGTGESSETARLFETQVTLGDHDDEEIWLEEGSQRFEFTIILPATLPAQDHNLRDPTARLSYLIQAVIQGEEEQKGPRQLPSYSKSELCSGNLDDGLWLKETLQCQRRLLILHSPHPQGGVTKLVDRVFSTVNGLGVCEIRVHVDEWTIAARFPLLISIPNPSPGLTLFSFRVRLLQTRTFKSLATGRHRTIKQYFTILEHGQRPASSQVHPDLTNPALWRGKEAFGNDVGGYRWEGVGKLPHDDLARATTLPGIDTPIHNEHALIYQVFFSIHGQTSSGPMAKPGPGELMVMDRTLSVTLPSCANTSRNIDLPAYAADLQDSTSSVLDADQPCPVCDRRPSTQLCTVCPSSAIPHLRHSFPLGELTTPHVLPEIDSAPDTSMTKDPGIKSTDLSHFNGSEEDCALCSGTSLMPLRGPRYAECACEREIDAVNVNWDWDAEWDGGLRVDRDGVGETEIRKAVYARDEQS
ncbi:hypothetical protein BCR39DRAFT_528146 [Naematelia encephala]|uniref:Arrestin-like N-terminal domain-containing protein n=1 Tax=Naematelia encephala TaxID=71784 RepID=A0A1Y2BAF7_9TREE|nr:hypothetical protein BCR39DRAFT_528146 [Naematelia encephala]